MITQKDFDDVRDEVVHKRVTVYSLLIYSDSSYRPRWMTDDQWTQFVRYNRGEAVPTDPELIRALTADFDSNRDTKERNLRWAFSSVPGSLVGEANYKQWCSFIEEGLDVGL